MNLADALDFAYTDSIGISELIKVEKYLQDYQFIVIDGNNLCSVVYAGNKKDKKIFLHYKDNHYGRS